MGTQRTFASVAWQQKGKVTRRERFLAEMDAVIPWAELEVLIRPHYPKAGRGRRPHVLRTMLRLYFVQQWFRRNARSSGRTSATIGPRSSTAHSGRRSTGPPRCCTTAWSSRSKATQTDADQPPRGGTMRRRKFIQAATAAGLATGTARPPSAAPDRPLIIDGVSHLADTSFVRYGAPATPFGAFWIASSITPWPTCPSPFDPQQ